MKTVILVCIVFGVSMCRGTDTKPVDLAPVPKPAARPGKAHSPRKPEPIPSESPASKKREQEEAARLALLQDEWNAYDDVLISHDAGSLPTGEKEMLGHLLEAARLVEEIHMLQLHPRNLEWRDMVTHMGTDIEKRMFLRNQMPWCEDNDAPDCCAIAERPPRRIGFSLWPKGWKAEEFPGIMRQINRDELLSPFTVVRRNAQGQLAALPYGKSDVLGLKMRKLAAVLRQAAAKAPHRSLKRFLSSRADAFESDSVFPYDASDYDWIALEGAWEVTVGPYEVYRTPHQTKAMFEMVLGREDEVLTGELLRFKKNLQEMEDALALLVGEEVYKGRELDPRIAIRAIDVWMASGDARRSRGATVAYHLPNRGASVEEGLYKKVILVNHAKAFEAVKQRRASLVLDRSDAEKLSFMDDIVNTTFHELSHGFGAYHEMKVTTPSGKTASVKQLLLELDTLMEEVKADVIGLWLSRTLREKGELDDATLERRYISAIIHCLGLFQYPMSGTYPRMAAIELGWYLDAGAVVWRPDTGRLDVVPERMTPAVESLAKHVATIQLTGDYAGARELHDKYIRKTGPEAYELSGVLQRIRETILNKFEKAGIKSPSLRYEVTGLGGEKARRLSRRDGVSYPGG